MLRVCCWGTGAAWRRKAAQRRAVTGMGIACHLFLPFYGCFAAYTSPPPRRNL
jgi:hypothetical protein